MKEKKSLFRSLNLLFWLTLGLIILYVFPMFNNPFFSDQDFDRWYNRFDTTIVAVDSFYIAKDTSNFIDVIDTNKIRKDTLRRKMKFIHWKWVDYNGTRCDVSFSVPEEELKKAKGFREGYIFMGRAQLYRDFINACKIPLYRLNEALEKEMNKRGLTGQDRLDFLVTAIQTPKYTTVTDISCGNQGSCQPGGCCGYIQPFAIYTPTEFIFARTGDCDTKSLICYALLKMQGVRAAMLTGKAASSNNETPGGHAMLGVAGYPPVIPSKHLTFRGERYYPWETTNYFTTCQLGNMRMWSVWINWEVTYN